MSLFRDVEPAWIGYAMVALLIALGLETARSAARLRYWSQAVVNLLVAVALIVTAFTPSFDDLHVLAANVAMLSLLANVTLLLFLHEQWFWLVIHLVTPTALSLGAFADGYGVWQKGMILYFLAATAALNYVFDQWMTENRREELQRERWRRRFRAGKLSPR